MKKTDIYFTCDRIENDTAILIMDDGKTFEVPAVSLYGSVHEGTVLTENEGMFYADIEETERRRAASLRLLNTIKNKFRKIGE